MSNNSKLTPERYQIISNLAATVDWNSRFVRYEQKPENGIVLAKPVIMIVGVDDTMLIASQILQLQAQHNKSLMSQAIKSGLVKPV